MFANHLSIPNRSPILLNYTSGVIFHPFRSPTLLENQSNFYLAITEAFHGYYSNDMGGLNWLSFAHKP